VGFWLLRLGGNAKRKEQSANRKGGNFFRHQLSFAICHF
jgi:hypothetical protein